MYALRETSKDKYMKNILLCRYDLKHIKQRSKQYCARFVEAIEVPKDGYCHKTWKEFEIVKKKKRKKK